MIAWNFAGAYSVQHPCRANAKYSAALKPLPSDNVIVELRKKFAIFIY
jgi:hypothetical protein